MHEFLSAIGFGKLTTRKDVRKMLKTIESDYDQYSRIELDRELDFCELRKEYGDSIGISVYGEIEEKNGEEIFEREYYVPYFKGNGVTSHADLLVERRADRNAYVGICEDMKVEVTLIFHLQNAIDYMEEQKLGRIPRMAGSLSLSGLAGSGTILFPVRKNAEQQKTKKEQSRNRMMLLSAAREGDSAAMESLTLEDIDTYSKVSRRLVSEDVYSIVESYFMPYGVECDQYSILGEILEVREFNNNVTGSKLYALNLDVNELQFEICVPADELIGEPAVGRRFKGNILLQGKINFKG